MSEKLCSYLVVAGYGLVISKMAFLHVPAIIIGLALMLSAGVAWIDRKQCTPEQLDTLWSWKLRKNAAIGASYSLLVPLAVLLSMYHTHGARAVEKDVYLRVCAAECVALTIAHVLFFFLTVADKPVAVPSMKPEEYREAQTVNLSFYVLMSLMAGMILTAYFLPWLGWREFILMSVTLFISLLCLSQAPILVPHSFSLGEAAVCCQALAVFLLAVFSLFLHKFGLLLTSSKHLAATPDVVAFMEVAVVSCLLDLFLLYHVPVLRHAVFYYLLVPSTMALFSLPMLYMCLHQDFVLWLVGYIRQNRTKTALFSYWAGCLATAIFLVLYNTHKITKASAKDSTSHTSKSPNENHKGHAKSMLNEINGSQSDMSLSGEVSVQKRAGITTVTRKQFHVLAVCVMVPGLLTDVEITCLSMTCAFVVFLMLESMRLLDVPPCGRAMEQYLLVFVDQQDQGPLLLTPVYLLIGCALPLWLFPTNKGPHICLYSGLLSLGVGDTVASAVGSNFGSWKWFGSKKTVEGTVANIISQIVALQFMLSYELCSSVVWPATVVAITVTALVEALTTQIDNLILPLITYSLILAL